MIYYGLEGKIKMSQKIYCGDHVVDNDGNEGIVVEVTKGYDQDNHGMIAVWQMNRYNYGMDNCEHYPEFNWQDSLTIVDKQTNDLVKLNNVCRDFIDAHQITCAEAIYQVDNNIIDAPELIEEICNVIGYFKND